MSCLSDFLDYIRPPTQYNLSRFFTKLELCFKKAKQAGSVATKKWYRKNDFSEISEDPSGQLLYETKILYLPQIFFKNRTYRPIVSQTYFVRGLFPAASAEILTVQIDLSLEDKSLKNNLIQIEFARKTYRQEKYRKYELRHKDGRLLTASEFNFVKDVFRKAINLLHQYSARI